MATPIKIFSAYLHSLTAGLSPHKNERVELFFAGCRMAREGNPCDGCFNQDLWYDDYCHIQTAADDDLSVRFQAQSPCQYPCHHLHLP